MGVYAISEGVYLIRKDSKNIWGIIIQTLITILTAIGTSLGVTSCL
ncbi:smalltalk protein [Phocaeicola salanitronis]